jgi:hypothetical protein
MAVVRITLCSLYVIPVVDFSRYEHITSEDRTHIPAADLQIPGITYADSFKFGVYQLNLRQPTVDQFNAMSRLGPQATDELLARLASTVNLSFIRQNALYGIHNSVWTDDGHVGSVIRLAVRHLEPLLKSQLAESERLVVHFHMAFTVRAFSSCRTH